jgi:hypothetical protein
MKDWLKDHFEYGCYTPKPVGYCQREPNWECEGCSLFNLIAWFIQATIFVTAGVGLIVLIVALAVGGIRI